ncbi:MAG: hypothetical protein JOS17DRAFT_601735 [Linnemannia elongata]|nr:MAG: hypothetical protein JOS17DRAFT_601735 [Linnemannia elongata]
MSFPFSPFHSRAIIRLQQTGNNQTTLSLSLSLSLFPSFLLPLARKKGLSLFVQVGTPFVNKGRLFHSSVFRALTFHYFSLLLARLVTLKWIFNFYSTPKRHSMVFLSGFFPPLFVGPYVSDISDTLQDNPPTALPLVFYPLIFAPVSLSTFKEKVIRALACSPTASP